MAQGPGPDGEHRIERGRPAPAPGGTRSRVGEVLRKAYDEVLDEPVPDAFAELLRKLDQ